MDPSDVSFDSSNYFPLESALLGDPLEESVCGADSWSLFEESLLYPSDGSFVFPIMAHQKVHFLEIYLRRTTVGPSRGAFLRPY